MNEFQEKSNKNRPFFLKIRKFFRINKRIPVLKYLEFHIVDHCNLNCMGCSHFSPLAPDFFEDIQSLKNNLEILSKKLKFKNIRIMGGEPLLHPKIESFLNITREFFPKANISIVTNGILLKDMREPFWDSCRKEKIAIDLSKYPETEDIFLDNIALIKDKGISLGYVHECRKMYVFHNPKGDSNKEFSYKYCPIKQYTILKGNKIFVCPKAAYVGFYNKEFKAKVSVDKGINIEKSSDKNIAEYIKKPVKTCKFCSYGGMQVDWKPSEKKQEEWNVVEDLTLLPKFQECMLKKLKEKNQRL